MENLENKIENQPRDITREFETMDTVEFIGFLRSMRGEPSLSITTDWKGVRTPRSLKAFVDSAPPNQKRYATVNATREQYEQDVNAFESGVKWKEIN
ncbi:MAG TPA: hypothetical protein PLD95_01180 [bacterium]|jgi:hypothetical protein|nr:hypothetical protein [bacterium]HOG38063.1 hypothetical protein [bacterium]HQI03119.1 hypothetical protein [bacterium]